VHGAKPSTIDGVTALKPKEKKVKNVYERILSRLSERFVRSEEIARILALAVESGKNILLWGPGGHGKSEMVTAALSVVTNEDNVFVQSFGEGMDEATLWGGLDFRALEEEKVLRYFPENSFLAKDIAVFEELFDAPATVLLALKDTLTARKLRKGSQSFPMKTKVIVGITNRDPSEIADLGPAAAALVERFPLQYKVEWPTYKSADYLQLFNKVAPHLPGADLNGSMGVLAELVAKAGEGDSPISPRSAVYALGVVKAAASLRGDSMVHKEDLVDLRFIDGLEGLAANIKAELDAAYERAAAESRLQEAERKFQALLTEYSAATSSPIKLLQASKRFLVFQDEAANLKVTDGLAERRKQLREAASKKGAEAQAAALENTRI
jgi:energy-coupling factor transporter ATP-binding protein EcfA2